jgi:hypothetical protein
VQLHRLVDDITIFPDNNVIDWSMKHLSLIKIVQDILYGVNAFELKFNFVDHSRCTGDDYVHVPRERQIQIMFGHGRCCLCNVIYYF